jgi:4-diphosphocytidyl-2-C-methyl-D-erythritol kinase
VTSPSDDDESRELVRERAHAKVNLVLRVGALDADGYHTIETVFQRLALADDVGVSPTTGACELAVSWEGMAPVPLGPDAQNLAWRAAAAYRDATGWPTGWRIALRKRIPAGAGLGGGSSDAAAVLRALESVSPRPMGAAALLAVGARLGADVPFFVANVSCAIGRGRGERIEPLAALPRATVALARPEFGIATAEAYRALDQWRVSHDESAPAPLRAGQLGDWEGVRRVAVNDFEPPTFARYPVLSEFRDMLAAAGGTVALLSGSGSAVFGAREGSWDTPISARQGMWFALTQTF